MDVTSASAAVASYRLSSSSYLFIFPISIAWGPQRAVPMETYCISTLFTVMTSMARESQLRSSAFYWLRSHHQNVFLSVFARRNML